MTRSGHGSSQRTPGKSTVFGLENGSRNEGGRRFESGPSALSIRPLAWGSRAPRGRPECRSLRLVGAPLLALRSGGRGAGNVRLHGMLKRLLERAAGTGDALITRLAPSSDAATQARALADRRHRPWPVPDRP